MAQELLCYWATQKFNKGIPSRNARLKPMPDPSTVVMVGTGLSGLTMAYLRKQYPAAKPYVEWAVAAGMVLCLSPIILLCALIVKITSRGPAFYLQERVGLGGRTFRLIKLRTMRQDAESATGPVWAQGEADPRVTPFGRFLRKTHMDEFPQLVNVLLGQMALVGPRPERPHFVEQLSQVIPDYSRRLSVKPGITGLAQVRAGYDHTIRDVRRKVRLDLMYLRRMCWGVDMLIIWATFTGLFGFGKGAMENNRQA